MHLNRIRNPLIFGRALIVLSWQMMMVIHEVGHCVGAILTGGQIVDVQIHPLRLSQTDVYPNPRPAIVVWLGPVLGCLIPTLFASLSRQLGAIAANSTWFFAGFCLIANGCYIGVGAIDLIGDCAVMFESGTSRWLMVLFGFAATVAGFYIWHRIGQLKEYFFGGHLTFFDVAWIWTILVMVIATQLWWAGY